MQHDFPAQGPQHVYVEVDAGELTVTAEERDGVTVTLDGPGADRVTVDRRDDAISVVAPRRSGFLVRDGLQVRVEVPVGSRLTTKLGSAGVVATGQLGAVRISTGSGSVSLEDLADSAVVKTGSGTVRVRRVGGEAELKTGSGDITVDRLHGSAVLSTGSGSVRVGSAEGSVVLKSGSGDLAVAEAEGTAVLKTASGDLSIGRMRRGQAELKNVSGQIRLGVPDGTPVWTDVSTTTGRVVSALASLGAPAEGQDHVAVKARSLTGDIHLRHL